MLIIFIVVHFISEINANSKRLQYSNPCVKLMRCVTHTRSMKENYQSAKAELILLNSEYRLCRTQINATKESCSIKSEKMFELFNQIRTIPQFDCGVKKVKNEEEKQRKINRYNLCVSDRSKSFLNVYQNPLSLFDCECIQLRYTD
ncbi:unnamed protein product [Caenorhabditis angaria]|uniref:DUF19 domain-containing protein n=1 Tax=Caenorhabditis angaria TaxID=860376 RepID=A0A9P1ICL5_9PELO|nr:unnamed protein product [Caenorhabditis angaria]